MAMTKSLTIDSYLGNISFDNAYIKVESISGNKEQVEGMVIISSEDRKKILFSSFYNFIPNMEDNFIKQAYLYLKTLPEYADAIDC
jgi:hypothetical protein